MGHDWNNMTEIKTLISQSDAIKIEPNVLKCFSLRQIYIIKKSVEDEKNSAPPLPLLNKYNTWKDEKQNKKPSLKYYLKISIHVQIFRLVPMILSLYFQKLGKFLIIDKHNPYYYLTDAKLFQ